jgi:hypothetical protein
VAAVIWYCQMCGPSKTYPERGRCELHVRPYVVLEPEPANEHAPVDEVARESPATQFAPRRMALLLADGRVEVPPEGLLIGRSLPTCRDLPKMRTLTQISRDNQARLYWEEGVLYVVDGGSTNGTFVAGVAATRPLPLHPGAALRFGEDVQVEVVELDDLGMLIREE